VVKIEKKVEKKKNTEMIMAILFTGLHYSTLHNQNEDGAGEKVDPSTGKKIDNSTDFGLEGLTIIKPDEEEAEAEEEDDAAAEWLRKNDPKFK